MRVVFLGWEIGESVEWRVLKCIRKGAGGGFIVWTLVDVVYWFEEKIEIQAIRRGNWE